VARRNAVPERSEQTGESSFAYSLELSDGTTTCTQRRVVHFVDPQGTAQRADLARRSFLGGASLWALGFDSPATWQQLRSIAAQPFGSPATSTTVER
jgi:spore germination protein YaaH